MIDERYVKDFSGMMENSIEDIRHRKVQPSIGHAMMLIGLIADEKKRTDIIKNKDYDLFDSREIGYAALCENEEGIMSGDFPILKRMTPVQSVERYAAGVKRRMMALRSYGESLVALKGITSELNWTYFEDGFDSWHNVLKIDCEVINSINLGYLCITVKLSHDPAKVFISELYKDFNEFKQDILNYLSNNNQEFKLDVIAGKLSITGEKLKEYYTLSQKMILANFEERKTRPLGILEESKTLLARYYTDSLQIDFTEHRRDVVAGAYSHEVIDINYAIRVTNDNVSLEEGTIISDMHKSLSPTGLIWNEDIKEELVKVSDVSEVAKRVCFGADFKDLSEALTEIAFLLLSRCINRMYLVSEENELMVAVDTGKTFIKYANDIEKVMML